MTITYKHSSGDTVICHGLGHPGEAGYYTGPLGPTDDVETEWAVEDIKPIGAADATPADRGCGVHVFDLWVEQRFATEDAARTFAYGLAGTLPRGGVSLEASDTVAAKLTTYATAVLHKLVTRRTGCSVDVRFTFRTSVPVITDIPEA